MAGTEKTQKTKNTQETKKTQKAKTQELQKPQEPQRTADNFLEIQDLHKSFAGQEVLRGTTIDVRRGETMVIIGRSGGGKSVLLKHVIGLLKADSGSIKVDGCEITALKERQLGPIRRRMGMLFQDGALFDSMNVAENVAFPLFEMKMRGRNVIYQRVRDALSDVGLQDHLGKMPANLSGGMRKRAALARAIVTKPDCILYDEPQSGLDPVVADSINILIRQLQQKYQITSVVVTHDMTSAYRIADRIAFYKEGVIYFLGTAAELKNHKDPIIQDFIAGRSRPIKPSV